MIQANNTILDDIKKKIVAMVTKKVLGLIAQRASFLAWGPIGFILAIVIGKIIKKAMDETIIGATMLYIEMDVNKDVKRVKDAIQEIEKTPVKEMTVAKAKELDDKLSEAYIELISIGKPSK